MLAAGLCSHLSIVILVTGCSATVTHLLQYHRQGLRKHDASVRDWHLENFHDTI